MKKKILIVEDDEGVREILRTSLSHWGHEVMATEDAIKALSLLEEKNIYAVVSDYRMPGMNGLDLLIIANKRCPAAKLILITADLNNALAAEAKKRGFLALQKPFFLKQLRLLLQG